MPEILHELFFQRDFASQKTSVTKPCMNGCKIEYAPWYQFCPVCGEAVKVTLTEKYTDGNPDSDDPKMTVDP